MSIIIQIINSCNGGNFCKKQIIVHIDVANLAFFSFFFVVPPLCQLRIEAQPSNMLGNLHVQLRFSPLCLNSNIINNGLCIINLASFRFKFLLFKHLVGLLTGHKCEAFHGFFKVIFLVHVPFVRSTLSNIVFTFSGFF